MKDRLVSIMFMLVVLMGFVGGFTVRRDLVDLAFVVGGVEIITILYLIYQYEMYLKEQKKDE